MLTTTRSMNVIRFSGSDTEFGPDPKIGVAPCERMYACEGEFAYTNGAPASAPTIEFSMDGENWDYLQSAPAGANPAPGVTLYTWEILIETWAFVRVTIQKPNGGGAVRGAARIRPVREN
jgi:hypothetical protein